MVMNLTERIRILSLAPRSPLEVGGDGRLLMI